MESLGDILQKTIQSIEETTVCFYQNKSSEGYRRLDDTLLQLDFALNEAESFCKQGGRIKLDENKILEQLTEAMKALEQRDALLVSDILEYEVKALLEKGYVSLSEE